MKDILVYRYQVLGSRNFANFIWILCIFSGSLSFFKTSYESFYYFYILQQSYPVIFFPQGLVMGFYSILGLTFSIYAFLSFYLKIGYGFNEFNKKEKIIRIFRWGFPGKSRRIEVCYYLNDIKSININNSSNNNINLCLKGDLKVNLLRNQFFDSPQILEAQAIDIAKFLGIPLVYV